MLVLVGELKRYDEELAAITQAINLAPRAAWYYNRGILYYNQQKYKLALDDYNKAIELNPNYALAYYNRGNLYRRQQKYKLALDDYNQTTESNGRNHLLSQNHSLINQIFWLIKIGLILKVLINGIPKILKECFTILNNHIFICI